MKTFFKSNIAKIAALLLLGVLSFCWAAPFMTQPEIYQRSIASLQAKQETVLELTAASTAASAAITLLPGDTATPIADKLADLSGYFLIVLCAIFLEKYLLTITAGAAFRLLFPLACLLLIAYVFRGRKLFAMLAVKLFCFGVAIMLIIPASVYVSDTIENTYSASINAAIENAKTTVKEAEAAESAASGQEETTGLSGLLSKVTDGISKAAAETVGRFQAGAEQSDRSAGRHAGDLLPDSDPCDPVLPVAGKAHHRRQHPAAGARQRRKSPSADVS